MKVRATRDGFYGDKLRKEDEEFELTDKKHFSKRWMEPASKKPTPKPEEEKEPETLSEVADVRPDKVTGKSK